MSIISSIIGFIPLQAWTANQQHDIPEETPADSSQAEYFCVNQRNEDDWGRAFAQYARDICHIEDVSEDSINENLQYFQRAALDGGRLLGFSYNQEDTPPSLDRWANFINFTARVFDRVDFRNWFDFGGMARTVINWRSGPTCQENFQRTYQGTLLYVNQNEVCRLFDNSNETSDVRPADHEERDAGAVGAAAAERDAGVIQDGDVEGIPTEDTEGREIIRVRHHLMETIRPARSLENRLRGMNAGFLNEHANRLESSRRLAQGTLRDSNASEDDLRLRLRHLEQTYRCAEKARRNYTNPSNWR